MLLREESLLLWQRDGIYTALAFGELTYSNHLPGGYEIEVESKLWDFEI